MTRMWGEVMTMPAEIRTTLVCRRGMTLTELVIAMGVLLICSFIFVAAFPMATQTREKADMRSTAISLANRHLEACRDVGYNALITANGVISRGLADAGASGSPYPITNATLGTNQSIANTLPNGTGTMTIQETAANSELLRITITINWRDGDTPRSVSVSTLLSFL